MLYTQTANATSYDSETDSARRNSLSLSVREQIDVFDTPERIVKGIPEISLLQPGIPLKGLLCHHYAITLTLGLDDVPEALGKNYNEHFLNKILDTFFVDLDGPFDSEDGDLVVYADPSETLKHFGIQRNSGFVESKWGEENVVFLHPKFHVPLGYGDRACYLRAKIGVTAADINELYEELYGKSKASKRHKKRNNRNRNPSKKNPFSIYETVGTSRKTKGAYKKVRARIQKSRSNFNPLPIPHEYFGDPAYAKGHKLLRVMKPTHKLRRY